MCTPGISKIGSRSSAITIPHFKSGFGLCNDVISLGLVLQRQALHFARRLLKKNGYFLCKLFQGQETFQEMRSLLESLFHIVHLVKPSASRYQSPEMYLLAMQYHADSSDISLNTDNNNQRIETKRNEIEKLLAEARRIRTKKNDK
ncbi:unnamed protein product [Rotaria sp. Silwood2]|nr:unnamed protein product [Rotaria sp. Silwood2]